LDKNTNLCFSYHFLSSEQSNTPTMVPPHSNHKPATVALEQLKLSLSNVSIPQEDVESTMATRSLCFEVAAEHFPTIDWLDQMDEFIPSNEESSFRRMNTAGNPQELIFRGDSNLLQTSTNNGGLLRSKCFAASLQSLHGDHVHHRPTAVITSFVHRRMTMAS